MAIYDDDIHEDWTAQERDWDSLALEVVPEDEEDQAQVDADWQPYENGMHDLQLSEAPDEGLEDDALPPEGSWDTEHIRASIVLGTEGSYDNGVGHLRLPSHSPEDSPRWASATEIQSLLFPADRYTLAEATAWATAHQFPVLKAIPVVSGAYHRVRVHGPKEYMPDRMRTITLSPRLGIRAVVGVPRRSSGRQHLRHHQRAQQEHLRLRCPTGGQQVPVPSNVYLTDDMSKTIAPGTLAYQMAFPKVRKIVQEHGFYMGRLIACGSRGCAYELVNNPKLVLKITADPTEVAAIRVIGQVPPDVRRSDLGAIARFTCTFAVMGWWGIVMPRLFPLQEQDFHWLKSYGGVLATHVGRGLKDPYSKSAYEIYSRLVERRQIYPPEEIKVRQVLSIIRALLTLRAIGLAWEDLTEHNVLQDSNGNWQIIDLGRSRWSNSAVLAPQIAP